MLILVGVLVAVLISLTAVYLHRHNVAVLQPAGTIGHDERNLIIIGAALSLAVVVPVFTLLGVFAWKYREGNHKANYNPEVGGSKLAETIWWLIPSVLIGIISLITWQSSYALDPFKPLKSTNPTLHIQVVALDWKWLFIYPQQQIASINEIALPVNTPVDFEITSDSVMNSFWIPQLGGQMYAMPGMATNLNLQATKTGNYRGVSANISGKGFAGMTFTAQAMGKSSFTSWINHAKSSKVALNATAYKQLVRPSSNVSVAYYSAVDPSLYNTTVMKYMMPMEETL